MSNSRSFLRAIFSSLENSISWSADSQRVDSETCQPRNLCSATYSPLLLTSSSSFKPVKVLYKPSQKQFKFYTFFQYNFTIRNIDHYSSLTPRSPKTIMSYKQYHVWYLAAAWGHLTSANALTNRMLQLNLSLQITVITHALIRKFSLSSELIFLLTFTTENKLEADYALYPDLHRDCLRVLFAGDKV
jgi:hypothetical protein